MAAADYIDTVQEFYIAYYGRPADPEGLAYWTARLDAAKGNLDEILDAFGTSDEADTLFGNGQTNEESVTDLYNQIFGRDPDDEGLEFYVDGLDSGEFTLIDVARRIVDGAQNDDVTILENKVSVANAFTDAVDADSDATYVGDDAAQAAREFLATVNDDADSVTAALEGLDAEIADITPVTRALVAGSETITGSSVDDTFTAVTSSVSTTKTLDLTDKITGGTGDDTLSVTLNANFTGFTTGSVSGVETVALTNGGTTTRSFDMTGFSGVSEIVVDATEGIVNLVDVPTGVESVVLDGQEEGTFTADFATNAAEVTGTSDEITLELGDVGTDTTDYVTVAMQSIEDFNIVASGSNVIDFSGNNVKTITVSGDGDLNIISVGTGITSFDASASTGDITVNLTEATGSALDELISTGSGDDSVTFDENGDGPSNSKFDLGAGDDTLNLNSNGGTIEYALTGVETLAVGTTSTATLIFSGRKSTGIEEVSTSSATGTAVSLVNMGANDLTLTAVGATQNFAVTSDHSGDVTVSYEKLSTTTATTTLTPLADYTFANATGNLTVAVGKNTNPAGSTITANKASAVVVNVDTAVSSSTEYTVLGATTITANAAESITVTASGQLNGATIASTDATTATVTSTSTTAGSLVLNTPDLTELTVASKANLNLSTSTLSDLQVLNVTANLGAVTFGALTDVTEINLSGAGSTSSVVLGNLGQTSNEYGLNISASGLEANLQIGTIAIGEGYDIEIDVDGLAGAFTVGNIAGAGSEGDNVVISANDVDEAISIGTINADADVTLELDSAGSTISTGAITAAGAVVVEADDAGGVTGIGAITATGNVTVNASGATGAVTVGALSGNNIIVDISGSASGSTVNSSITAKTSANLTLNDLEANTSNITAKTGSTGLTVTVVGGIGDDAITVTGISTSKSVTISGDLSASSGNDTLVIDTRASTSAQTINFSGLEGYETARVDAGNGADTITGGDGADTISAGQGADSITGGAGNDVFIFNTADSKVATYDTIVDLEEGDVITWGGGTVGVSANVTADSTKAGITNGIASFSHLAITAYDTLAEMVDLVETSLASGKAAYFEYLGSTFLVIDTGDAASEIVVKLVGFALPTDATAADDGSTGLTGIGG